MKHDHELSPDEFQRVLTERAKQYDLTHPKEVSRRADEVTRLYIEAEQTIADLRHQLDTAREAQERLQDELAAMARWRDIAMRYADVLEDIVAGAGNPVDMARIALKGE